MFLVSPEQLDSTKGVNKNTSNYNIAPSNKIQKKKGEVGRHVDIKSAASGMDWPMISGCRLGRQKRKNEF
jgi:hypothetical protein